MYIRCIVLLFGIICGCTSQQTKEKVTFHFSAPGPKFESLFNGKDFTGWNIQPDSGAWIVQDQKIICKGEPRVPYLIRTLDEYENFEFYAEFNVSSHCNSGIFYHVPREGLGRMSRLGFETQILDDSGDTPDKSSTGSIYDVIPPKLNAMKPPGEWNQYRVLFDWPNCKVWLNGYLVQDVDFNSHQKLKYRFRRGDIGLSNHGHRVEFRNLWIKTLPDKVKWQVLFNGNNLMGWMPVGDANWEIRNGYLQVTGGAGYLVTTKSFEHYHLQTIVDRDLENKRKGGIYIGWKDKNDPGMLVEFSNSETQKFNYPWPVYQIINADQSILFYGGNQIYEKSTVPSGKMAIYHHADDGPTRIINVRLMELGM